MNTPSPLVPQGTSPDRGKSTLHFKILMILTVHVVLIGGMLLQGCKDTKSTPAADVTAANDQTNTPAPDLTALPPVNTNIPPAMTPAPATSSYTATPMPAPGTNPMANNGMTSSPIVTTPMAAPAAPTAPEAKEYIVARGDILANIAKKNGVTLKALMASNPGVEPRKLKIGAKLQLPDSATSSTVAATGAPGAAEPGDTSVYTVKAGDMLGRIAKAHGTTVSKIKALNDLKTTSIRVGQKLKLPGAKGGSEASTAASAPSAATTAPPALYAAAPQTAGPTH